MGLAAPGHGAASPGFLARVVRWAFLLESASVALEGILLGTALSLVTSSLLFCNDDLQGAGVPFLIPWANVALLAAASGAASLATAWPARRRPGQAGGALGIAD